MQRINAREANPNDRIRFIRSLQSFPDHAKARAVLDQIAALFEPLMREIGISVRSLEEAAYNREYGGRNWNAGEVIELVLRRPNGTFAPFRWLVLVMAHELAHCKHMNHGPSFKKTNAIFLKTVLASLAAGFTGVGFWGKGNTIEGEIYKPLVDGDLPEFTCGGQSRKRSAPARKRKPRKENGAAKVGLSTGRQTRIQRKPGGRVTREGAFVGEGVQLNAADSTFRKQAGSKKGIENRLVAIERRMAEEKQAKLALQPKPATPLNPTRKIAVGAVGAKAGAQDKGKRAVAITLDDSSDEESEDEDARNLQRAIQASLADGKAQSWDDHDSGEEVEDEEANEDDKARIWGEIKFEKEEREYLRTNNWEEQLRKCGVDHGEGAGAEFRGDGEGSSSKGKGNVVKANKRPVASTSKGESSKKQRIVIDLVSD